MGFVNNSVNGTDFSKIAPYYDFLQKLVFRQQLQQAQSHFLDDIQDNSIVLVVGGGTGKILHSILSNSTPQSIIYVEKSAKMIELARSKFPEFKGIEYINEDVLEWNSNGRFDAIVLPFVMDVFSDDDAKLVLKKLGGLLKENGQLIYTDFVNSGKDNRRASILISTMYWFFKLTANLKTQKLPNVDPTFNSLGFKIKAAQKFCSGMVESRVYHKPLI